MIKILSLVTLIIAIFSLSVSLQAASSQKVFIAINNLERQNIDEGTSNVITDRLRTELFKTGSFTVLERDKMKEILEEQKFQVSGCISSECLVEIGQLLGV
ncbi:MAG: hypothetical protein HQK83_20280, partial [Fibrobacteria bacterium]|nr:hypothetical protein [Fibrobacteria bacterium]